MKAIWIVHGLLAASFCTGACGSALAATGAPAAADRLGRSSSSVSTTAPWRRTTSPAARNAPARSPTSEARPHAGARRRTRGRQPDRDQRDPDLRRPHHARDCAHPVVDDRRHPPSTHLRDPDDRRDAVRGQQQRRRSRDVADEHRADRRRHAGEARPTSRGWASWRWRESATTRTRSAPRSGACRSATSRTATSCFRSPTTRTRRRRRWSRLSDPRMSTQRETARLREPARTAPRSHRPAGAGTTTSRVGAP